MAALNDGNMTDIAFNEDHQTINEEAWSLNVFKFGSSFGAIRGTRLGSPFVARTHNMADDNPHATPFSTITKEPGKRGAVLTGKVADPQVTVSEESEEEEHEVTITPDFVKNNREVLKAKLAELEHQEKLEKLKARLTYEDDEPEGTSKKPGYSEELWEKIFKVMEENKGPKKSGGETNDGDDPLLKPYQPTNSTDLSKFTRRIAEAPLPEKLKLPANFHQKKKAVKNPNEILHIRRRDDEKVEQFMERFISESMQIQGVPEVMKISSFINGVRQPQLCEKLGEDFPTTFDSLMDKVRAFVRGKDTSFRAREWEQKKGGNYRSRETQETARNGPYTGKGKVLTDKNRQFFTPYKAKQTEKFTPLIKTPSEILATEKIKNSFLKPQPLRNASRPNPDEFCDFHKCYGHKTDDCLHLKREIEAAVKSGKLSHLVKEIGAASSKNKEAHREEKGDKAEAPEAITHFVCYVI
ncbi:hypothetical protein E3N88_29650 [Mikania micrantha]|uniref:Retrotransposon gag domain-containing protein n=1 Tax=Mikania micrantha TaxID=192012 RepID=A0A5N6MLK2_9ASTR|nr:hypothetical protein E3N88_29650 [Mikania micrantha]